MGLYFQDHRRHPGGLDLLAGSHRICADRFGKFIPADTALGDFVVWNLRTIHSGCGWMLRFGRKRLPPDSLLARTLSRFPIRYSGLLLFKNPAARVAAFMTFGRTGSHLDRYIAYLKSREYAVEAWRACSYGQDVWKAIEGIDLEVLDLPAEILRNPLGQTNVKHVPLPY